MQRLEHAPLDAFRTGACDRCGSTENMVDTDILISYEGIVVLCGGCIGEAALIAGYLPTEDGARKLAEAEARAISAEAKLGDAEKVLATLQGALNRAKR